jgi:hypothetical protein
VDAVQVEGPPGRLGGPEAHHTGPDHDDRVRRRILESDRQSLAHPGKYEHIARAKRIATASARMTVVHLGATSSTSALVSLWRSKESFTSGRPTTSRRILRPGAFDIASGGHRSGVL